VEDDGGRSGVRGSSATTTQKKRNMENSKIQARSGGGDWGRLWDTSSEGDDGSFRRGMSGARRRRRFGERTQVSGGRSEKIKQTLRLSFFTGCSIPSGTTLQPTSSGPKMSATLEI
jgi:hypothetical protein